MSLLRTRYRGTIDLRPSPAIDGRHAAIADNLWAMIRAGSAFSVSELILEVGWYLKKLLDFNL